jgi:methyl-accepting chemotaxis protein
MLTNLFKSLSLVDASGFIIIALILLILGISLLFNGGVRARYAALRRDLRSHERDGTPFRHPLLRGVHSDVTRLQRSGELEGDIQTLIDFHLSKHLSWALTAERFFKAAAGIMIVLGLVGTFYGLTLSIGKLAALITEDASGIAEITASLTQGLAGALSGMSVAFSTSLVGILSAITVMLVGVFRGPRESRNAFILELEVFLRGQAPGGSKSSAAESDALRETANTLHHAVASFGDSLQLFSGNIRDFKEFNTHLKDNIQRMSLQFADLSETLKQQAALVQHENDRWSGR